MAKSKQNRRKRDILNPNHIMSHNHRVHDGVYEEDTMLERIALGCTLLLLLPIIGVITIGWWMWDVIVKITKITRK